MNSPSKTVIEVVGAVAAIITIIVFLGSMLGWCGEAKDVARKEFSPSAMLEKYEWFKNAAAQLEKKQADIAVFEGRAKAMDEDYKNVPRREWPRDDREQYNVWTSEVAGIKASYNALAAEYNAQMTKFNWSFANASELPKGAENPLPREFRQYVTQ